VIVEQKYRQGTRGSCKKVRKKRTPEGRPNFAVSVGSKFFEKARQDADKERPVRKDHSPKKGDRRKKKEEGVCGGPPGKKCPPEGKIH